VRAARPGPAPVGAIHLATAQVVLGDGLTAFVTYDRRPLAVAPAQSVRPFLNRR